MIQCRGIWLPNGDTHMAGQVRLTPVVNGFPTYQYGKLQKAMEYVARTDAVIDIGAHVGLWAVQLATLFDSVHAFEPVPAHLECLRKNTAGMSNVTIYPTALGVQRGATTMRRDKHNTGQSFVLPDSTRGESVSVKRLDDFSLDGVGLIKVDCEGYEYFALSGGTETISRSRPVVVVEQDEPSVVRYGIPPLAACSMLKKLDYVEVAVMTVDHIMVPRELL